MVLPIFRGLPVVREKSRKQIVKVWINRKQKMLIETSFLKKPRDPVNLEKETEILPFVYNLYTNEYFLHIYHLIQIPLFHKMCPPPQLCSVWKRCDFNLFELCNIWYTWNMLKNSNIWLGFTTIACGRFLWWIPKNST